MKRDLPRRVYLKHGAFWYVDLARKWHRLCAEREGLPAMYRAFAKLTEQASLVDRMPAVMAAWADAAKKEKKWSASHARNVERTILVLGRKLAEFAPADVTSADVDEVLESFADRPRTYNLCRNVLRQCLAYASRKRMRDGANPVVNVPGKSTPGRKRHATDAEIAAVKKAALTKRNGVALVQMIDLALLTGQRIGDIVAWRWQDVTDTALMVEQRKTGKRLAIELTPALRAVLADCARGKDKIGHILKTQSGSGFTYAGMRSKWDRACTLAGVNDLHIHDLRGRAGVDKREVDGMEAAKDLLGHDQMATTAHYIEGKTVRRVKPTR